MDKLEAWGEVLIHFCKGLAIGGLLTTGFLSIMKSRGAIDLDWGWVILPVLSPLIVFMVVVILGLIITYFYGFYEIYEEYKRRNR